jgi:hypothetical protein
VFAGFAGLARALSALRAPFAMAGLTILALWLPQQVREVYRVLAQPVAAQPSTLQWQWVLAAVSLGLLAIVLWQASREIAHLASADQSLDRQPVAKAVTKSAEVDRLVIGLRYPFVFSGAPVEAGSARPL